MIKQIPDEEQKKAELAKLMNEGNSRFYCIKHNLQQVCNNGRLV